MLWKSTSEQREKCFLGCRYVIMCFESICRNQSLLKVLSFAESYFGTNNH